MSERNVIVGVTGASGAIYAKAVIRELLALSQTVHLIPTVHSDRIWHNELEVRGDSDIVERGAMLTDWNDRLSLSAGEMDRLIVYEDRNIEALPASGTFWARAMIVVPCSMNTLARIAHGMADTLLTRAAGVSLKERRPLILVPRETPLSLVDLRNLVAVAEAGAVVLPAMPAFYQRPATIEDLVHHLVSKVCDQLGLPCTQPVRYSGARPTPPEGPAPKP